MHDTTLSSSELEYAPTSSVSPIRTSYATSKSERFGSQGSYRGEEMDVRINDDNGKPSKRERLRRIGERAKIRTKHMFTADHTSNSADSDSEQQDNTLQQIQANLALNPERMLEKEKESSANRRLVDKVADRLNSAKQAILDPRRGFKKGTASMMAISEHPYLSSQAQAEYLHAHDELKQAEASRSGTNPEAESQHLKSRREQIQELDKDRESMRVAWITSVHVQRVRVTPRGPIQRPIMRTFEEYDAEGKYVRFQWQPYIGHLLLYWCQDALVRYIDNDDCNQSFDQDKIILLVERIILASAPWQEWLVNMRNLYRWEDPAKTIRWYLIFNILWYYSSIITFAWCYIIYLPVCSRLWPSSEPKVRETHEKSLDQKSAALKFTDLMRQHGDQHWIDPLVEKMGPWLQLMLVDLADFLEVLVNFYDWKRPEKTVASLCLFASAMMLGVFTDLDYCARITYFLGVQYFFLARPIASKWPKYRHNVPCLRWIFYDIPTHAEWSFEYLQQEAESIRKMTTERERHAYAEGKGDSVDEANAGALELQNELNGGYDDSVYSVTTDREDQRSVNPSREGFPSVDLLSFRCAWHTTPGRLSITSSGLRFVRLIREREVWYRPFTELCEMRKIYRSRFARAPAAEALELKFDDGTIEEIAGLKNRDELFNVIIGFSGLRWQTVQVQPGERIKWSGKSSSKMETAEETMKHVKQHGKELLTAWLPAARGLG